MFVMVQIIKAMIAEDRILAAVSDIKNIKDRKGTASDDAVRVIMKKWWIPSDSKIATTLKWYSHDTTLDKDMTVIDIANHLVERSATIGYCLRYDIIHEVPSNGFKLPGGAGTILGQKVWYIQVDENSIPQIKCGTVLGISLAHVDGINYHICIYTEGDESTHDRFERDVFIYKEDLEIALRNKWINLMNN